MSSCNTAENDSQFADDLTQSPTSSTACCLLSGQSATDRAVLTLAHIVQMDVTKLCNLVHSWLAMGVNLALAEPFVVRCAEATGTLWDFLTTATTGTPDADRDSLISKTANVLLQNTRKRIILTKDCKVEDFFSRMFGDNLRLESIAIFFTAASRAMIDTAVFPSLYTDDQNRRDLLMALTHIADCCLETCLSLDCLNDLQIIIQYESFIVHTLVYGDQSTHVNFKV